MARKRWKRKSGYVTPQPTVPFKDLIRHDLFITPFYDDWNDWRDGFRDWFRDFKLIKKIPYRRNNDDQIEKRIRMNQKQEILLKRRRVKKEMEE